MADRPTITIKPGKPARDPRRPRVRGGPPPAKPARLARTASEPAAPPARPRPGPKADERPQGRPPAKSPTKSSTKPFAKPTGRPPAKAPGAAAPRATPNPPARPAARTADEGHRVNKLITERGIASRREADDWIAAGWVKVNGQVAQLGQRAPADAVIEIDERARQEQQHRVTVLLHKPVGWVSGQPEDGYEPAVALVTAANQWEADRSGIRFHPGHLRHLAPAGRLDIDSTGLLVLTQDGRIARHLVGDETRVEKEYLVRVERLDGAPVQSTDLAPLRHGLELDGVQLRPAQASWQNEQQLRIVLREGRKRQIRRMCELVGLKVLALKRVRIGSVPLGPLPEGRWRYLREDERF
jgi:23S rRNA pseudouridine2604 synthase